MRSVRLLPHFLFFIALTLSLRPPLQAQTPTGKEFLVTLPAVMTTAERNDTSFKFRLEIFCSRETKVSVQLPGNTNGAYLLHDAIVQPGGRIVVQRPMFELFQIMQSQDRAQADTINMRAFLVTADQPVSVHATFDKSYRSETYSAVPTSAYDTAYTVLTYAGYSQIAWRSGFLITASENGTTVTITPSVRTYAQHAPGLPYTITLQKNQVYQVLSNEEKAGPQSDLTGTTISATKPVGLLSFSISNMPTTKPPVPPPTPPPPFPELNWRAKTMMNPQMPNARGGKIFYTLPFARQDTSRLRFIALQDSTTFTVNGARVTGAVKDSIFNRGMIFEIPISVPTKIEASKPVIGMQFAYSSDLTKIDSLVVRTGQPTVHDIFSYGDPMMVWLMPIDNYTRAVQWITPLIDERPPLPGSGSHVISFYWEHFLMLTAPVEARGTIFLDGRPVDLPITHQDGAYASGILRVTPAGHVITSDYPVNAVSYGFTWNDSYGMNSSEALRSVGKISIDTLRFTTCSGSLDTSFIVSNLGNNIFRIDSAFFSGVQGKVLVPATFPQAYNPGANNNFAIVLTLPQPGTFTGTLRLYSDANNRNIFEIPIIATRDSAQLVIPTTVDFGVVGAGETQHDTTIALRNNGPRPLIITAADFAGTGFSVLSPQLPDTIAGNGVDSLKIRFVPVNGTAREATMKISGAPCLTPVEVKLRGFQGGGASLLVQRSLNYPSFLCTAPPFVDSTIMIRSIGDEPVSILTAAINGTNKGDFTLLDDPVAKSPILPKDTMRIRVRFTPGGSGPRSATLDLTTSAVNAPTVSIDLQGRKDTAFVMPSVTTIDFGTLKSCDDPRDTIITLQNNGSWPDTISAIDIGGSADYIIGSTLPLIVYPGSTQELKITFAPKIEGKFPVTLNATDGPCGGGMKIVLNGERVAPSLQAGTTDLRFDTLYSCDLRPVTRKIALVNNGKLADTITRASFAGSTGFSTGKAFPIILLPGESDSLDLTFTPTAAGDVVGAIALDWGPCQGSTKIDLLGVVLDPQATLSATDVDFGQVDVAQSMRRTITVRNTGTAPRIIEGVDLGTTGTLRVTQPASFPVTLAPGEELTIEIEYTPDVRGTLAATGTVRFAAPCSGEQTFGLKGEGIGEEVIRGSLTLGLPARTTGMIDDTVKIPISIAASSNLAAVAPTAIRLVLRHDYTMLVPTGITTTIPGMTAKIINDRIVENDREMEIELSGGTFPSEGEIAQLESFVLIGDAMTTPLTIDSVSLTLPQNRVVSVSTTGGEFDLLGVCLTGGNRLVRLNGSLALKPNRPNPFRSETTIDFETSAGGTVQMVVLDASGRLVATLFDQEISPGSYSIHFDGSKLPSGLYFCELRSSSERLRRSMLLVQ
jgi:hypothetical protein